MKGTDYYHIESDVTVKEFLAVSKLYAGDVVEHHDLSVDVYGLEWEVSKRAKRRAGAVKYRNDHPEILSLTWRYFQTMGWEAMAETIRHELVHVHLLNEHGDSSHGERFRTLADRLQTGVHCERFSEPKWWIICRSCGRRLARYRRSKLVTNVDLYQCGACGGDLLRENTDS